MGAWDSGPFDNDDAADWVVGLVKGDDVDEVATALEVVAEVEDDAVNIAPCCCAVAAAEVVSAARGYACRGFSKELKAWIRDNAFYADRALTTSAKAAVRRVLGGSELADLWEDNPGWRRRMNNLAKRLSQPSKAKRPKKTKRASKTAASDSSDAKTLIKDLRKLGASVYLTPEGVIEGVDLSDCRATAADTPMIARISSLQYLAIYYDDFGDSDLQQLSKLPRLEEFVFDSCENVTDEGLRHVAKISTLIRLEISYCGKVTDAGLRLLSKLPRLERLMAEHTGVTKKGVAAFRKALPGCEVRA